MFPNQYRQPGRGVIKLEGKTMLMRKKDPNRHVDFRQIQPVEIYFRFADVQDDPDTDFNVNPELVDMVEAERDKQVKINQIIQNSQTALKKDDVLKPGGRLGKSGKGAGGD